MTEQPTGPARVPAAAGPRRIETFIDGYGRRRYQVDGRDVSLQEYDAAARKMRPRRTVLDRVQELEAEVNRLRAVCEIAADTMDWAAEGMQDFRGKGRLRRTCDEIRSLLAASE